MWYQKLNNIASKYVFIIESYGSLTTKEEDKMYSELIDQGFNIDKVKINFPKKHNNYGQLDEFVIEYNTHLNRFMIGNNDQKDVKIKVVKSFYTKK